jgi:hypothetical protein
MKDLLDNEIHEGDTVVEYDPDTFEMSLLTVRKIGRSFPGGIAPACWSVSERCIACSDGGKTIDEAFGEGWTKAVWASPRDLIVVHDSSEISNAAFVFSSVFAQCWKHELLTAYGRKSCQNL